MCSAAQQDYDVDEQQAYEDEGEVDEELLQVPLGLWVHLNLRRPAYGRLGHVLHTLHLVNTWDSGGGSGEVDFGHVGHGHLESTIQAH